MKKLMLVIAVVIGVGMSGCGSYTVQHVERTIKDDSTVTAKIYVMRSGVYAGKFKFRITQDDKFIGDLGAKSYLSWEVDVAKGGFKIISSSDTVDIIEIVPEAGKVYYIRDEAKLGVYAARTDLTILSEEEGKRMLKGLREPKKAY